ncbi:50S ribosomal protein L19e [Candidatus Woesearchaeota archaeon]|nr:50S ribosomal protein L19e [Candidatus Woesearchaeota archaeon]
MKLGSQRRLAAQLLKCGAQKIWFDPVRLQEIKEAITKNDLRRLIKDLAVQKRPEQGIARGRARHREQQKRKGRQQGPGAREGSMFARVPAKRRWINKIRVQRSFLKELKAKKIIGTTTFHSLYQKAKGGFFRSRRHIKLYLEEHAAMTKHETPKQTIRPTAEKEKARKD